MKKLLAIVLFLGITATYLYGQTVVVGNPGGIVDSPILFPDGTVTAPSISFSSNPTLGMRTDGSNLGIVAGSADAIFINVGGSFVQFTNSYRLRLLDASAVGVLLGADAAHTVAQKDGANAQESRIYNIDSGANDEFLSIGAINVANEFRIESEATGTGTVRNIRLEPGTADLVWGKALVALGGGAAPTLGTIGGGGPATAAQNTWMRVVDSTGAAFWVPAWK